MKKFREVYLDYAATTPIDKKVLKKMMPYLEEEFGNPSSMYQRAQNAKYAVEDSRKTIADIFGCNVEEITFTNGGTESDNLAILGVARANKKKGKHIITTTIEHPAVLNACKQLENEGFEVTYIPVNEKGLVELDTFKKALRDDTILVSVMYVNNEVGTIQPIKKIGDVCKKKGILFHTDACQAAGYLEVNVNHLNVDLMTINGSKLYGPKGIGTLYIKKGIQIEPLIYGGSQEYKIKPGTENVPYIIGLAEALKIAQENKDKENDRLRELRDMLLEGIIKKIPKVKINGDMKKRVTGNLNVSILDIEGESLLLRLDMEGIAVSTGSACSSGSLEPSHVLLALGLPHEVAHGSMRVSLGRKTTEEDVKYFLKVLPKIVKDLRDISPVRL